MCVFRAQLYQECFSRVGISLREDLTDIKMHARVGLLAFDQCVRVASGCTLWPVSSQSAHGSSRNEESDLHPAHGVVARAAEHICMEHLTWPCSAQRDEA